ncbi:MAG: carbohydrate kinase family protein [Caldilineaceae bacterium]
MTNSNTPFSSDVISLGDLVADLIVSIPHLPIRAQEHQPAREMALEAGGNCNFLIMAARLGLHARAFGAVGRDDYGRRVLELLLAERVNIDSVTVLAGGRTGLAIVLVDDEAQHVFVGKHGEGAPQPLPADWQSLIQQTGALFTSGYDLRPTALLAGDAIMECLAFGQAHNIPLFFDLGPPAFHYDRARIEAVIDQTTVFLATAEEAAAWTGLAEPRAAARQLLQRNPALVIIKLGADGCLLATAEEEVHAPGFTVPVRDTTGAGDAFAAACVYGYQGGLSLTALGYLCNAVGAAAVGRLGAGTRLPHRADVEALLETISPRPE